jgi:two-component system CheB/CheR fusion protein
MPDAEQTDFPIVGVGASAGGLDAYRQLLTALPDDSGAAFVFIQHLDPNHDSMMANLLAKFTSMPVLQADQNMPVAPNHVYIIPPNKFIKLVDHGLFLEEPVKERGIRMSIDYFLRSMADVRGEKSIGILLSGTGSDGSLGMREIKDAGGLVVVQDPSTAEYDGMPRAAINTGTVDFVLPIEEIPETLINFIRHPYLTRREQKTTILDESPDHFRSILNLLRAHTDYDFRCYKKGTLERRIQRRMGLRQIASLGEYLQVLRESPNEATLLFKDLLIGVTRFFRDREAWEELEKKAIAPLIQRKPAGEPLRAWIPGCASGEEAYTATMILCNQLEI